MIPKIVATIVLAVLFLAAFFKTILPLIPEYLRPLATFIFIAALIALLLLTLVITSKE